MMKTLTVATPSKTYPIHVGSGLRFQLLELCKKANLSFNSFYIVTDSHVAPLYLDELKQKLSSSLPVYHYMVTAGEEAKSFDNYYAILSDALSHKLDRGTCIIALGGGVVGDLAGFVAATLLRGVGFIQIPTTVLAHDSSVGGKVAINHPEGKNLVGAFYHPDIVIYDTETLATLPDREIRSGFVEVIKHSLIADRNLYESLKQTFENMDDLKHKSIEEALIRGIAIKADVVNQDEREQGIRSHLNFGHTLGHALEKELGYGVLTHGEAVAIGMIFAMYLSEVVYKIKLPIQEVKEWFKRLELPVIIPEPVHADILVERMLHDKKTNNGVLRFVLMEEMGKVSMTPVDKKVVTDLLNEFIQQTL